MTLRQENLVAIQTAAPATDADLPVLARQARWQVIKTVTANSNGQFTFTDLAAVTAHNTTVSP